VAPKVVKKKKFTGGVTIIKRKSTNKENENPISAEKVLHLKEARRQNIDVFQEKKHAFEVQNFNLEEIEKVAKNVSSQMSKVKQMKS
jgi:hypothetical protein